MLYLGGMQRLFTISLLFLVSMGGSAQIIPDSTTTEVVNYYGDGGYNAKTVWYYKPWNYDSTSPILWVMHGLGGSGEQATNWVKNIANKRKALIVAPDATYMDWAYSYEFGSDTSCANAYFFLSLPQVFKQLYRHVLQREGRDSMDVYFTGFSAGGQAVTRYMLARQIFPDSIPIKMAVSVNPYTYAFCIDSLNGNPLQWPLGILTKDYKYTSCHYVQPDDDTLTFEFCNDHVLQYYNENYGVLIGTADTLPNASLWGNNRYETAQSFYNYSDTNAVTRGTTLKWVYDTVSDVGHAGWAMYNTAIIWLDTSVAEHMIFDTPWHPVPQLTPIADFKADNREVWLLTNPTVQFTNKSVAATSYVWEFGDGTYSTATNPSHQYTYVDTFTVRLRAYNSNGCESYARKWDYIIVHDGVGIDEPSESDFSIHPNPTTGQFTVQGATGTIQVHDLFGRLVLTTTKPQVDMSAQPKGVYIVRVGEAVRKLIVH